MDDDRHWMKHALQLAARGEGHVEPNPMVGCVIVRDGELCGQGWHQQYGEAHAEVHALREADVLARGATAYVTLEPCCHAGKTPPCSRALIDAGVARVVVAHGDPFPQVRGGGIEQLRNAGIVVETGVLEEASRELLAPYLKLTQTGRPWVIAKWAMTLDGRIATRTGDSRWISSAASRKIVHQLRGRVDAIAVGRGTAEQDNPQLTARPVGPRVATRIVVDPRATLSLDSHLAKTATETPVRVYCNDEADEEKRQALSEQGVKVVTLPEESPAKFVDSMLKDLGQQRMTNVLVEGGGGLIGSLFDAGQIDEIHVFMAPKLIGGSDAIAPVRGMGVATIEEAWKLEGMQLENCGGDVYVHGRVGRD